IKASTSTGPGGQSVNTTYSAIRITHRPSGLVVSIQDEKSQLQNKEKAMRVLRARLYEMKLAEQQEAIGAQRRGMVRSGNRSEKIRTYNFKENRVTDHRISLTLHKLDRVMAGDLDELVSAAVAAYRALVARRGKGEPVAYLVGAKEFMGLAFEVTRDVLVPNPDTEVLVQRAVAIAREAETPVRVADVGTGSGCIAISIAHYAP